MAHLGQAVAPCHLDPANFLATHVAGTWVTPEQVAWLIRRGWQMSHIRQRRRKAEKSDRYGRPESARTGLGSGGH